MKEIVELSRHTWNAAIKLAVIISIVAGFAAIVVSAAGDVPQAAIVLPVIIVAFTASWIQTSRAPREHAPVRISAPRSR
jgi:ABC-type Mn2+/Zn2+ transport system permease subunit